MMEMVTNKAQLTRVKTSWIKQPKLTQMTVFVPKSLSNLETLGQHNLHNLPRVWAKKRFLQWTIPKRQKFSDFTHKVTVNLARSADLTTPNSVPNSRLTGSKSSMLRDVKKYLKNFIQKPALNLWNQKLAKGLAANSFTFTKQRKEKKLVAKRSNSSIRLRVRRGCPGLRQHFALIYFFSFRTPCLQYKYDGRI